MGWDLWGGILGMRSEMETAAREGLDHGSQHGFRHGSKACIWSSAARGVWDRIPVGIRIGWRTSRTALAPAASVTPQSPSPLTVSQAVSSASPACTAFTADLIAAASIDCSADPMSDPLPAAVATSGICGAGKAGSRPTAATCTTKGGGRIRMMIRTQDPSQRDHTHRDPNQRDPNHRDPTAQRSSVGHMPKLGVESARCTACGHAAARVGASRKARLASVIFSREIEICREGGAYLDEIGIFREGDRHLLARDAEVGRIPLTNALRH